MKKVAIPQSYWISRVKVSRLWGYRDMELHFKPDVNIIIGPNASGKTTILNLLYFTLGASFRRLAEIRFGRLEIELKGFFKKVSKKVIVETTDRGLHFRIGTRVYNLDVRRETEQLDLLGSPHHIAGDDDLSQNLRALVPAVWLPVSRRLPLDEEIEGRPYPRSFTAAFLESRQLESVDERLKALIQDLAKYRLQLDAQLAIYYKQFERRVLELILFNKQFDTWETVPSPPTEEEEQRLVKAFEEAGLLDSQMTRRISEHFQTAHETVLRLRKRTKGGTHIDDIFIVPLIRRTKSMVEFARTLEQQREEIFAPLKRYEGHVNRYFNDKKATIAENGELVIEFHSPSQRRLRSDQLSSGEKQILILLTQALLREGSPVVYVADEPELSLHVSWQEQLVPSLLDLGKQIQIILATHSPDIVGRFVDRVIDLGAIKR